MTGDAAERVLLYLRQRKSFRNMVNNWLRKSHKKAKSEELLLLAF